MFKVLAVLVSASINLSIFGTAFAQSQKDIIYPAGSYDIEQGGRTYRLIWDAGVVSATSGGKSRLNLAVTGGLDLKQLQDELPNELDGCKKNEDCGDRVTVSSASLGPFSNGRALLRADVNYQRWGCASTRVPEVFCEDTWVKLPFGGKTKGIPKCRTTFDVKEAKTRLLSQSGTIRVSLKPQANGRVLSADARVESVQLSGALGEVVRALGLQEEARRLAQREMDAALARRPLHFDLPNQLEVVDFDVQTVSFTNRGNGGLGINFTAQLVITKSNFLKLLKEIKKLKQARD